MFLVGSPLWWISGTHLDNRVSLIKETRQAKTSPSSHPFPISIRFFDGSVLPSGFRMDREPG
jgi:hypothetical protein